MNNNNTYIVSWDDFKNKISNHIKSNLGPRMCRGQSNSNWSLVTSFHRDSAGLDFSSYFEVVKHLSDVIGTLENRIIDTRDAEVNGSFLAFLQHHGFPTPLLDWSLSPYIAAYFAFSDANENSLDNEYVSIFVFDFMRWSQDWKPIYDYTVNDPHVSLLKPKSLGNRRQINQQGFIYTWTNVPDIKEHILLHEQHKSKTYLEIYKIPVKEKFHVMTELEVMGITAFSLFGSIDSLCKYYKESLFRKDLENKSPSERMIELLYKNSRDDFVL